MFRRLEYQKIGTINMNPEMDALFACQTAVTALDDR
jgi:hypothetical protein